MKALTWGADLDEAYDMDNIEYYDSVETDVQGKAIELIGEGYTVIEWNVIRPDSIFESSDFDRCREYLQEDYADEEEQDASPALIYGL